MPPSIRKVTYYIAIFSSMVSLILGAIVIVGWYTHNPSLIQVNPTFVPMQYNTAMGFLLSGVAILALACSYQLIAGIVGAGAILIGGLSLMEYIFGVDFLIDQIFMQHYITVETPHPGRMAANTAFCFSLTGVALLFASLKKDDHLTPIWISTLGAIIIALGTVALAGYLTGIETAVGWGKLSKMAVHTASGFIFLGAGLAAYAWHKSIKTSLDMPYWVPTFAGTGSMTITVSLWQALNATEARLPSELTSASAIYADEAMLIFGTLLTIALVLAIRFAEDSRKQLHLAVQARKELLNSQVFTKAIVETAADGIILSDANGVIEAFNPAAERIFGYTVNEVVGNKVDILMPEAARVSHDGYIKHYVETGESKAIGVNGRELTGRRKDGSVFPLELSLAAMINGGHQKFTGIVRDITERKMMQDKIEEMAYFDPLTGLPNRALHYDRLKQSLAQGRRNKKNMALLFLDLDSFKPVNDNLGHEYGDQALIEVAKRLKKCVRETDSVSRIGGDEFCIILENADSESAACSVAEKIHAAISQPMHLNSTQQMLGCSIGICIPDRNCKDIEAIMTASDNAMYEAKKNGKNCYRVHKG